MTNESNPNSRAARRRVQREVFKRLSVFDPASFGSSTRRERRMAAREAIRSYQLRTR